ncbi:MAG TPA: secretin and TonB N-terminal domain-containing protein [Vicinamibacterales bacterium]|nr:secretin and TonB N-terminal domain-containing protein [Vicinamibacterales bacterium]
MRRRSGSLIALALVAVTLTACAAGRAFRRGEEASRLGDWDAAVVHYRRAVQEAPDRPEYKIQLERAMQNAAREHITRAREMEESDQLDIALREYRRALEYDSSNRLAASKAAELERVIRERVEASRPKPRIDQLRELARATSAPPILNPASRDPLKFSFTNAALRDVINTITSAAGINAMYDSQADSIVGRAITVNLDGVTLEQALDQILASNGLYYKVLNPRTIIVIPDVATKHAQYDELAIRTFYLSHAEATDVMQVLNQVVRVAQAGTQPVVMMNKTANTITVRATVPMMDVIERVIRANDKPRAEIVIDVEILEVNRNRVKQYGINLSDYSLNMLFSPEGPPGTGTGTGTGATTTGPRPFNLNTISGGVSTTDFYMTVPSAVVRFLESDSHSRVLAKPQLRGAEGGKLTLNLGEEIPVLSTVFGAAAAGGFATIPQSSFTYRSVGVNIEMTPRVTYEGEIVLELAVENSARGADVNVAGQTVPSFSSRKVSTRLRLREGESNLLAGLIRENSFRSRQGLPGLNSVPGIREIFSGNDRTAEETDIVMLLTPHIVRTHELTAEDLGPIYIGTQQRIGLSGAPQLIAPQEPEPPAAAPGAEAGQTPVGLSQPGAAPGVPAGPQAGAAPPGVPQPVRPTVPPGTSPVPGQLPPPQQQPPAAPAQPIAPVPEVPQPAAPTEPAAPVTQPAAPATQPRTAQLIVTPPGTEFRVGGGPYTVPISINGVSRLSTVTLTLTFNPAVVRARTVQEGTFMRQGGATPAFTPRIDPGAGRVDVAITRTNDATGASGSGLLAAVLFDAIAPGTVTYTLSGTATTPDGAVIPLSFAPVTVTVR